MRRSLVKSPTTIPSTSSTPSTPSTHSTPALTVMNYNTWLHDNYSVERIKAIVAIVREKMPDVVCLHELCQETLQVVETQLSDFYQIFQVFIEESEPYGSAMLCKMASLKILSQEGNPYFYDYDDCTKMGRKLLGCEVQLLAHPSLPHFHLLTTHLENLKANDDRRAKQFNMLLKATARYHHCIVAGDFNIWSLEEDVETLIRKSRYKDAWVELGCPSKAKYSYDGTTNLNLSTKTQLRSDRILYHSSYLNPKSLSLVGREIIDLKQVPIQPSNHYGVYLEFIFDKESVGEKNLRYNI